MKSDLPSLTDLAKLAEAFSSTYASPHHFTMSVDAGRNLLETVYKQQDAIEDQRRLDWLEKNFGENVVSIGKKWYVRKGYGYPHVKSPSIRTAIDSASKE